MTKHNTNVTEYEKTGEIWLKITQILRKIWLHITGNMENVEEIGLNVTLKLIYFWTMSENGQNGSMG